jgi:hypothetical protein
VCAREIRSAGDGVDTHTQHRGGENTHTQKREERYTERHTEKREKTNIFRMQGMGKSRGRGPILGGKIQKYREMTRYENQKSRSDVLVPVTL